MSRRRILTVAAIALLAPLFAACTKTNPTTAGPAPSSPVLTSPSVPSDSSPPAPSPVPEKDTRCHTAGVKVTVLVQPGGGAAGSVYNWLIFTNVSGRACTLYGFPGVSYVTSPSGAQVNDPAKRVGTPSRVTLAPNKAAHAQVQTGHPEAFPDTCKPVTVAGYRVYLPDESTPVFVAAPMQQCSTKGVNSTSVGPVQPGATDGAP
jgi:hypothetical protein